MNVLKVLISDFMLIKNIKCETEGKLKFNKIRIKGENCF